MAISMLLPLHKTPRRNSPIFIALLSSLFSPALRGQQQFVAVDRGESAQHIGQRIIPKDKGLMHSVVTGDFGLTKGTLIILFSGDGGRGFTGWVLVPERDGYNKLTLPKHEFPASTEVRAVFFAPAGHVKERELFVLCKELSGVGRYPGNITPFYTTYVYRLDGSNIKIDEETEYDLNHTNEPRTRQQILKRLEDLAN
jgi:hypothetical protein